MGEKIGVTNKAISRWENGRGYPDVSILLSLANELDVSVDELLRGELNDNRSDFEKKNSEVRYKSSKTVLLRFSLTLIPLILAWTWILLSSRYTEEIYGPDGLNLNYLGRMFVGLILPLLLAHFANLFIGLFFAFRLQARKDIKIGFIILLPFTQIIQNLSIAKNKGMKYIDFIPFFNEIKCDYFSDFPLIYCISML